MERIKNGILIILALILIYMVGMFLLTVLGMLFRLVFTILILAIIGYVIYKMFERNNQE